MARVFFAFISPLNNLFPVKRNSRWDREEPVYLRGGNAWRGFRQRDKSFQTRASHTINS